jgi:hypothetical protein
LAQPFSPEVLISAQTRFSDASQPRRKEFVRLASMMALYFVVLVSVGILRPIKNALALDGLADGDFYRVYLVSAMVVLFAPVFNYLADHVRWRTLIPGTAAFFALNLLAFRAVYSEGSADPRSSPATAGSSWRSIWRIRRSKCSCWCGSEMAGIDVGPSSWMGRLGRFRRRRGTPFP